MARPVVFSATARLKRSHAHVNEPLGFGGDSPGGGKRLGCECRHDRLAEERVLLTVAGAQFKAGRRAIEGADKGAVAGADHDPVLPHQFRDWGRFVAVVEASQGHDGRTIRQSLNLRNTQCPASKFGRLLGRALCVTTAVMTTIDTGRMNDETTRLEQDMLLKCSKCGRWHAVHLDRANAGQTDYANEMLYWHCGKSRYYAGHVGGTARYPVKARGGD